MVYKDWRSLERDIVAKVQECTKEAQEMSLHRFSEYLDRFYDTPEPKVYIRTGELGSSASADHFQPTADGGIGRIEMNDDVNYTTGTYDTMMVFENAETGYPPSHMLGNPHFWWDTMMDIQYEIIPRVFGKYFRQV